MLVQRVKPSTCMPQWAATMASGTVDMPTASAPSVRARRTSAGVSYCGPGKYMYTPSRREISSALAVCRATYRSAGVYTWLISGNRGPNSSRLGPHRGLTPKSLIWSVMSMMSPAEKLVFTAPAALVTIIASAPSSRSTRTG